MESKHQIADRDLFKARSRRSKKVFTDDGGYFDFNPNSLKEKIFSFLGEHKLFTYFTIVHIGLICCAVSPYVLFN